MDLNELRYWPFDVVAPDERTDEDKRFIRFFETAYQAGYKPYMFDSQNIGATTERRSAEIVYRGSRGKHWEVFLARAEQLSLSAHVDNLEVATEVLLRWLGGDDASAILEAIRGHLVSTPGRPSGFTLHSQAMPGALVGSESEGISPPPIAKR